MVTHRFRFEETREAFDLVDGYRDGVMKAMRNVAIRAGYPPPGPFAEVGPVKCSGCAVCTRACPYQAIERVAINAPIQGSAADIIKIAMNRLHDEMAARQFQAKILLQIHDELVLEVPQEELAAVRQALPGLMCNVASLAVPLVAEVGEGANWEQAH